MKIGQVVVYPFPFPPNQWGGIEEVIWNYKINLEKLGHTCRLTWPDSVNEEDEIIHVHSGNQALMIHGRGFPYVFSPHDITPLAYEKTDIHFVQNKEAIQKSLISIVGGKFAIDLYEEREKILFLQYGVNSTFFYYKGDRDKYTQRKLVCVAKNDIIPETNDRKGFFPALNIAKKLGCFITISGPNQEWCTTTGFTGYSYPGLQMIDENMGKERLREMYLNNGVLVHLSAIETGQPCLVILEALSCGMPVVCTSKDNIPIPGAIFVDRNNEDQIIQAVETIFSNYDFYSKAGRKFAEERDWMNVVLNLEKIYKLAFLRKQTL